MLHESKTCHSSTTSGVNAQGEALSTEMEPSPPPF